MFKGCRTEKFLAILVAAITVVGAILWDIYTPYSADDNYYRLVIRPDVTADSDILTTTEEITDYSQAWRSIDNHRGYNGRLANFIHILFQPLPRTLETVILGLCIGLMYFLLILSAARRGRAPANVAGVCLVAMAMWLVLPWYDQFQSADFQINYIPASVLTLLLVCNLPGRPLSPTARAAFCLVGVLCSWLHEGFGAVLIIYFTAVAVLGAPSRRTSLLMIAALLAGIILNILLGTGIRIGVHVDEATGAPTMQFLTRAIPAMWPEFLATAAVILIIYRKRRAVPLRALALQWLPLLLAAWAGVCMALIVSLIDHVMWPAHLFAATTICAAAFVWLRNMGRHAQIAVGGFFAAIYLCWMSALCIWSKRTGDDVRHVFEIHGHPSPTAPTVFFHDYHHDADIPFWLMGIVRQPLDHNGCAFIMGLYMQQRSGTLLMLPSRLEGRPFEEWPGIPGHNGLRGIYPMLAARDSLSFSLLLKYGPAGPNTAPADRLFMALRNGVRSPASIRVKTKPVPVIMPDGTTIYRYEYEPLPRTITGRPFLSADTLPPVE